MFTKGMLKPFPDNEKPAIIANHLRASPELYSSFPGAKKITILRDVPSLYESSFGYFKKITKPYIKARYIKSRVLN